MNAKEIRKSLEPFANFAPAILKAAEIAEAAESAEIVLKGLEKAKAELEADVSRLTRERAAVVGTPKSLLEQIQSLKAEAASERARVEAIKIERQALDAELDAAKVFLADVERKKQVLESL
jgi:chromosome segregation ATPase